MVVSMLLAAWTAALIAPAGAAAASAAGVGTSTLDITATHGFSDAKRCAFRFGGERLFTDLEKLGDNTLLRAFREVGGLRLVTSTRRTSRPDPAGGSYEAGATVSVPLERVRWHGLPLYSVGAGFSRPPESDGTYWREVTLSASTTRVRSMLARLGVKVAPGGYHSVSGGQACGGALTVVGKGARARIRCEWVC
jgi:hypothetical protein